MKISLGLLVIIGVFFVTGIAAAEERFIEVRAKKFSYTPNIIRVNYGDHVRIRLISEDVHHGMFIDGYEIKTSAHPGQEGSLDFIANKKGKYTLFKKRGQKNKWQVKNYLA